MAADIVFSENHNGFLAKKTYSLISNLKIRVKVSCPLLIIILTLTVYFFSLVHSLLKLGSVQ